ncbi:LysR substrate-binding domain-containing protein [Paraburkholderia sp. SARCC-3016]|uniref:LysR substrate-binding domain-containing protein n=1 Tax=Paraburkholderia sp. SARCC-3016 TaxID=3058611 RepID=UPI0028068976|nr:LysR substrate-binding domain-containing protein [Paraburkholderia sp. SARCC-3016]MDQ7976760.1 LysR substrate-binding domain-containing protein [Paraburkholderia sp. SARCC-3016]
MPLRLPPLSSLRFFEAAARHRSFKLAAAELNVTPSAVSHGIVGLEEALGVELFVREPRGLSLTREGKLYLPYIAEAFALIAIGTQRLPDRRANRTIAVSCAPTLAMRWFVPRLARFREGWPNVNVTVDTSRRLVGFPADGFDFALRLSRGPIAGATCDRLFGERLVPVCSPAYLETLIGRDNGSVDLRRATLIHVDTASADWQAWLDGAHADANCKDLDASSGLRFDTVQLALEAAAGGLGVAIGRLPLADADLAARTLVAASGLVVTAGPAYWLVSAHADDERPEMIAFRRWLLAEAASVEPVADATGSGVPEET